MKCELIGGPKDGELVDVPAHVVLGDEPVWFPHDGNPGGQIEPVSEYRWLFGAPDHLDFAGWA